MFHRSKGKHARARNVGPLFALFAAGSQLYAALEGSAAARRQAQR